MLLHVDLSKEIVFTSGYPIEWESSSPKWKAIATENVVLLRCVSFILLLHTFWSNGIFQFPFLLLNLQLNDVFPKV